MNWIKLESPDQLSEIVNQSHQSPQVIFKHSTRCSISTMAKNRLERSHAPEDLNFHYLDLLKYRSISNQIAEKFKVYHESPQILVISKGECIYDESHSGIDMKEIAEFSKN